MFFFSSFSLCFLHVFAMAWTVFWGYKKAAKLLFLKIIE